MSHYRHHPQIENQQSYRSSCIQIRQDLMYYHIDRNAYWFCFILCETPGEDQTQCRTSLLTITIKCNHIMSFLIFIYFVCHKATSVKHSLWIKFTIVVKVCETTVLQWASFSFALYKCKNILIFLHQFWLDVVYTYLKISYAFNISGRIFFSIPVSIWPYLLPVHNIQPFFSLSSVLFPHFPKHPGDSL